MFQGSSTYNGHADSPAWGTVSTRFDGPLSGVLPRRPESPTARLKTAPTKFPLFEPSTCEDFQSLSLSVQRGVCSIKDVEQQSYQPYFGDPQTTTLSQSQGTRTTPTSRREGSAQNARPIVVNCPQPGTAPSLVTRSTPAAPILDPGAGFLVSFSRKSGTSRGAADVLSGVLEKQTPIGLWRANSFQPAAA
jgi:hypothetical protein